MVAIARGQVSTDVYGRAELDGVPDNAIILVITADGSSTTVLVEAMQDANAPIDERARGGAGPGFDSPLSSDAIHWTLGDGRACDNGADCRKMRQAR